MLTAHCALVVAAHPDDEMLGCGGTLAKLARSGAKISILLLGEGPASRDSAAGGNVQSDARHSALAAAASLGIHDVRFAGLPDNRFDSLPLLDIVKVVERVALDVRPELVLTHFAGDLNIDHQLTHRSVMTAFRPLPGAKPPAILSFEVLSSTEYTCVDMGATFHPNVFIDITGFLETKQKVLEAYASEMRSWPHPRSHATVEHLARLRGSQCGSSEAEAFQLCRVVI